MAVASTMLTIPMVAPRLKRTALAEPTDTDLSDVVTPNPVNP